MKVFAEFIDLFKDSGQTDKRLQCYVDKKPIL